MRVDFGRERVLILRALIVRLSRYQQAPCLMDFLLELRLYDCFLPHNRERLVGSLQKVVHVICHFLRPINLALEISNRTFVPRLARTVAGKQFIDHFLGGARLPMIL